MRLQTPCRAMPCADHVCGLVRRVCKIQALPLTRWAIPWQCPAQVFPLSETIKAWMLQKCVRVCPIEEMSDYAPG